MTVTGNVDFKGIERYVIQALEQELGLFMLEVRDRLIRGTPLGKGDLKNNWEFQKTGVAQYTMYNKLPYADYQNYNNLRHHPGGTSHSFSEYAEEPLRKRSGLKTPRETLVYQRGYRKAVGYWKTTKRGGKEFVQGTGAFDFEILFFQQEAIDKRYVDEFLLDITKKYGVTIKIQLISEDGK